jgi:AAA+ ATPase superfamily predicted ATPase
VDFVGRTRELAALTAVLDDVRSAVGSQRSGRCLIIRGRRRIGKSALVEEFVRRSGVPHVFYTAEIGAGDRPLAEFVSAVRDSDLPEASVFVDAAPGNWATALRHLVSVLPSDSPSVVVIDELPYLMDPEGEFESVLQRAWDRELSRRPVLLVLIGSDLSMMEALTTYGRPFHQRGTPMVVGPLNPADVATITGLPPAEALDATLVSGGLPLVVGRWRRSERLWSFLERELADPVSPLVVSAQLSLVAEFPETTQARLVLAAIGEGERTFSTIGRSVGEIGATSLTRALETLITKGIVAAELPVAMQASNLRRYRTTDPYLRFWLSFVGPYVSEIDRGRSDLTIARIRQRWPSWRGRVIEPLVRESLARLLPASGIPAAGVVGGFWTRTNEVEIDIVGADRGPVAKQLLFVGSIKWREGAQFDRHDLASLSAQRARLTDEPLPMIAVVRSGGAVDGVDAVFTPTDLLAAWPGRPPA